MAKRKYLVVHPVEHDGERIESGEITLDDKAAAPLLAVGSIAEKGKDKPAAEDDPEGAEG